MDKQIKDINYLVKYLLVLASRSLWKDELWQCYGYKKSPRRGSIWYKIFPKRYELEKYIKKELLIMGLIDVLNGIKKSLETSDVKLLISIGVIDQCLFSIKNLFMADVFMENLFSNYKAYLVSDKSKLYEPIVLKAKDCLEKKDFAKFMVGTIKLLSDNNSEDFLLKSDFVKDAVGKYSKVNKLKTVMPEEIIKKYLPFLENIVLGMIR